MTSPFIHSCVIVPSIAVVQSLSHVWLFVTPRTVACQPSLSFTISWSLLRFRFIDSVMLYNQSHPLLPSSPFALKSSPASGSFPMNRLLASGGQSTGASASASFFPMNIQGWFPLELPGVISLQSRGLSRVLQNHSSKASILWHSAFFMVQLSHRYMTTERTIALTIWTFVGKVMSLLFNMLSRFSHGFLPRSKCLLISRLQLPSAVILEPKKIKSVTSSTSPPSVCHEVMGPDAMFFVFWLLSSKPAFSLSSFTLIKTFFSSSLLSAIRVVSPAYLRMLIFLLEILFLACDSSSLAFHTIYSTYKLNKQGDNIQPCHTPYGKD